MTNPNDGDYQLICWGCGRQPYFGRVPLDDPPAILAAFAAASCPKGGTAGGCPSTADAQQNRTDEQPGRLRQALQALKDARVRGTAVTLPALTASTPAEIVVTWPTPMPDPVYRVTVTPVCGAGLLGALRWCIKPGGLTVTDCTLIVVCTQTIAAGVAGLHVVAAP